MDEQCCLYHKGGGYCDFSRCSWLSWHTKLGHRKLCCNAGRKPDSLGWRGGKWEVCPLEIVENL